MNTCPDLLSSPRSTRRALLALLPLLACAPAAVLAQRRPILRLAALSNGILIADGSLTTLTALDGILAKLKDEHGLVWYYREDPDKDPAPQAVEALKLVMKYELPVSLSSRPDYSDFIDPDGVSRPRRP